MVLGPCARGAARGHVRANRVLRDGQPDPVALARQRITEESLRQAVRSAGGGGLELVSAVAMEFNAAISVISTSQLGSGSTISGATARA